MTALEDYMMALSLAVDLRSVRPLLTCLARDQIYAVDACDQGMREQLCGKREKNQEEANEKHKDVQVR